MKRITTFVLCLLIAALLVSCLAGCTSEKTEQTKQTEETEQVKEIEKPSIVFDQKYEYLTSPGENRWYLVFHADHTGYYDMFATYSDGSTSSGRADFVWRIADDETVYLFQTDLTLSDDDTRGTEGFDYNFSWSMPITFGDGFLIALNTKTYASSYTRKYILEGSDLAKSLEKD